MTSCEPQQQYFKLGQKLGCNIPFPLCFIILDEIVMNIIREFFKIGMERTIPLCVSSSSMISVNYILKKNSKYKIYIIALWYNVLSKLDQNLNHTQNSRSVFISMFRVRYLHDIIKLNTYSSKFTLPYLWSSQHQMSWFYFIFLPCSCRLSSYH